MTEQVPFPQPARVQRSPYLGPHVPQWRGRRPDLSEVELPSGMRTSFGTKDHLEAVAWTEARDRADRARAVPLAKADLAAVEADLARLHALTLEAWAAVLAVDETVPFAEGMRRRKAWCDVLLSVHYTEAAVVAARARLEEARVFAKSPYATVRDVVAQRDQALRDAGLSEEDVVNYYSIAYWQQRPATAAPSARVVSMGA